MQDKNKSSEGFDIGGLISLDEERVKEIFDNDYQNKFIKILLTDSKGEFFNSIHDIIVPGYFDDYQRILIDKTLKYFNKFAKIPDFEDLKREVKMDERNATKKDHLVGLIDKIQNDTIVRSNASIEKTAYTFFKKRAVADALYKMASLWGKDDFEAMTQPLAQALKAGEKKEDTLDYIRDIDLTLGEEVRNVVPIMEGVDEEIGGGLAGGELAVVMAPTGGGKSMVLVAMGAYTMSKNKKVLYISLELGAQYIAQRFHSCFTKILLKELYLYPDVIKERLEEIFGNESEDWQNSSLLKIKKFDTRRLTVSGISTYLESLKRNENFVPDIIYLDYADIMNSSAYDKEYRLALQILYQELRGLSGEVGIPICTASQTSKSGSKLMYITVENVAESYAKVAETDLVLGIGRGETGDKDDFNNMVTLKQLNKATIGFLKNRMGADGFYKMADFDTSNVQIKIEKNEENQGSKNGQEKNFKEKSAKKDSKDSINSILERENGLS